MREITLKTVELRRLCKRCSGLNICRDSVYPDIKTSGFCSITPGKFRDSISIRPRPIIVLISTSFTSHPVAIMWYNLRISFTGRYLVLVYHTEFDTNRFRGKESNEWEMKLWERERGGGFEFFESCLKLIKTVPIYIYIYILRGFKTSDDAFRLAYPIAFDCSVRPFLDLFHSWLYIFHLSRFSGDGLDFSFLQVSSES